MDAEDSTDEKIHTRSQSLLCAFPQLNVDSVLDIQDMRLKSFPRHSESVSTEDGLGCTSGVFISYRY